MVRVFGDGSFFDAVHTCFFPFLGWGSGAVQKRNLNREDPAVIHFLLGEYQDVVETPEESRDSNWTYIALPSRGQKHVTRKMIAKNRKNVCIKMGNVIFLDVKLT